MTRFYVALAVGGALIASGIFAAAGGWWTPWASRYIQGVDVSHHQGAIDWRTLAADNVAFAYIKATEGADHIDTRFAFNWREAEAAGLYRGAYHFFTLCQPGARQASNFIAVVPRVEGALPPAVDLEHMGPCREGPTMPDVIAEARTFMDRVEQYYGVRPIIYTTREFHDAHLAELRGERFWIRSIAAPPSFRQSDWLIWQHHNRGHRRGVEGPVDLNAFRGDAAALARFARAGAQTVTWTLSSWQQVPSMRRIADEAAFQRGEAVFYQQGRQAEVMNIQLPAPAILTTDDGQTIAIIVVQAERSADDDGPLELLGGISPNGDYHVFTSADARLVEPSDPQWRALVAGRST